MLLMSLSAFFLSTIDENQQAIKDVQFKKRRAKKEKETLKHFILI